MSCKVQKLYTNFTEKGYIEQHKNLSNLVNNNNTLVSTKKNGNENNMQKQMEIENEIQFSNQVNTYFTQK